MRNSLLSLLLLSGGILSPMMAQNVDPYGEKSSNVELTSVETNGFRTDNPLDLLACPENSVKSEPFTTEGFSGYTCSDQGRPQTSTKFYQSFTDNYFKVDSVRVFAIFTTYDPNAPAGKKWRECTERAGINERFEMTKPIRLELSFYEIGEDDMPGKEIYKDEIDKVGRYTGIVISGVNHVYEFTIPVKTELKLETGFVSVSAVDMKDSPSCWFSLLVCQSVSGYAVVSTNGQMNYNALKMPYCFIGEGEYSSKKALKLKSLTLPGEYSDLRYQKVKIDIKNVGSDQLSSPKLSLFIDGYKAATEEIPVTLKSTEVYHYVFNERVDCSGKGIHKIEVRNETVGDEKLCKETICCTTKNTGNVTCESMSQRDRGYIKKVVIGSLSNESEKSNYTDFTSMKTPIYPGQNLNLEVQYEGSGRYLGVWVDWNENGLFEDEGELIGYMTENNLTVSIPSHLDIPAGDKRMRIIYSDELTSPCGEYYIGETEDYTLTVMRPSDSPEIKIDKMVLNAEMGDVAGPKNLSLKVSNPSSVALSADVDVKYYLPNAPYDAGTRSVRGKGKSDIDMRMSFIPSSSSLRTESVSEPLIDPDTRFICRYDKGAVSAITPSGVDNAIFANRYSKEMVEELKGMEVTSADIYLMDVPGVAELQVYTGTSQGAPEKMVYKKSFMPKGMSWNRIVFDKPIKIAGDEDIWIAVAMEKLAKDTYCMGVDVGPVMSGYADYVNVSGRWWQMGDHGLENNFCIRANVKGDAKAVGWLTPAVNHLDIAANGDASLDLSFNPEGLKKDLYEAEIVFKSNDKLNSIKKVRTYMNLRIVESVDEIDTQNAFVTWAHGILNVDGRTSILSASLYDMFGRSVFSLTPNASSFEYDLSSVSDGNYILLLTYSDGSSEVVKLIK